MAERTNNYAIQAAQAKRLFQTYDQQELIQRCRLQFDDTYFYIRFLGEPYRIHRATGDMQRQHRGCWIDGNSFDEVMTVLDWLCDSRADRHTTGRWVNIVTHGPSFHSGLQENMGTSHAELFDRQPEAFARACEALGGERLSGGDIGYAIELLDGLQIYAQLWHGDDEFPPRLVFLWDENATQYIRYETTWYAIGLLSSRLAEIMQE